MAISVNFNNPERLLDFAAVALSDGRKNMASELKVIAREYSELIEEARTQLAHIDELENNARQREAI